MAARYERFSSSVRVELGPPLASCGAATCPPPTLTVIRKKRKTQVALLRKRERFISSPKSIYAKTEQGSRYETGKRTGGQSAQPTVWMAAPCLLLPTVQPWRESEVFRFRPLQS